MRGDERLCPNLNQISLKMAEIIHELFQTQCVEMSGYARTSKLEESDLKGDAISLQGKLKTARYIGKLEL